MNSGTLFSDCTALVDRDERRGRDWDERGGHTHRNRSFEEALVQVLPLSSPSIERVTGWCSETLFRPGGSHKALFVAEKEIVGKEGVVTHQELH